MKAVLVILLIAGIAALTLGLVLITGTPDNSLLSGTPTVHEDRDFSSTEACFICHRSELPTWDAPGMIPLPPGLTVEPASMLRGAATIEAVRPVGTSGTSSASGNGAAATEPPGSN